MVRGYSLFIIKVLLLIFCLQLSCKQKILPQECVDFYSIPASQKEKVFEGFDLEKQIRINQCGVTLYEGSGDYSSNIAKRGKTIIPILLSKLNTSNDNFYESEELNYSIIRIFESMSIHGDLKGNEEIVDILSDKVSKMRTKWIRENSEEALSEIKRNSQ